MLQIHAHGPVSALQDLSGLPEAAIGYLIAARGLGNLASFCVVAQLTRINPRLCLCLGLGIQAIAGLWMGSLGMTFSSQGRDVEQHPARLRVRPLLHADGHCFPSPPCRCRSATQGNALFSDSYAGQQHLRLLTLIVFAIRRRKRVSICQLR